MYLLTLTDASPQSISLAQVCDAVTEAVVCTICHGYSKKIYRYVASIPIPRSSRHPQRFCFPFIACVDVVIASACLVFRKSSQTSWPPSSTLNSNPPKCLFLGLLTTGIRFGGQFVVRFVRVLPTEAWHPQRRMRTPCTWLRACSPIHARSAGSLC